MKLIAKNIYRFEQTKACNIYLLVSDHGLALVDAGVAGDVRNIVRQMEEGGFSSKDLRAIIVTHAHFDHIGGLPGLVKQTGAEIFCHKDEVPFIEGSQTIPTHSKWLKLLGRLFQKKTHRGKNLQVASGLKDGEILDFAEGLRAIHTPGHTPGSLCLYQQKEGILFCGDLLFNGHPVTRRGGLQYAPRLFSTDPEQLIESVNKAKKLDIRILCPGHGEPIIENAAERIRALNKNG